MIFLFRKEIKKWNIIWWFILASLALSSGASFFMFKNPGKDAAKIASINGDSVSLKEFKHVYEETKSSLDDLALYWGIPVDRLAKAMGIKDIAQSSLDRCIQNIFVDKVWQDFNVNLDTVSFQDKLAKAVSRNFIDQTGKLNERAYQSYLSRLHMSIADYEEGKEREFKRGVVLGLIEQGMYIPSNVAKEMNAQKNLQKQFSIMVLPMAHFLELAKKEEVSADKLKALFNEKQELYRVNEKAKVKYWSVTPEEYKNKIEIDEELIKRFYEENKASLYRIAPKIKISSILVPFNENAAPDMMMKKREEINKVYAEVTKTPEKFVDFVKQYPGKITDFFQRGTHDPELEKVAFLKLKNKGDISEVIQTGRGFEIIKLEDRIAAVEKPLDSVRAEIVKTLIDKKSIVALRSDMEAVMRAAKADEGIFEKFSASNNLKGLETDWISKDDIQGESLVGMLAQRLFGEQKKRLAQYGYFVYHGQHVLYRIVQVQESYIPTLEKISEKVKSDWYKQAAETLQAKMVKEIKKELLGTASASIDALGAKYGFKVIKTAFVAVDGKIEGLKNAGNLVEKAFVLNSQYPVLEFEHESESYLVKMTDSKVLGADKKEKATEELSSDAEKRFEKQRYLDAFVASLQRNATIEINQKMLSSGAFV